VPEPIRLGLVGAGAIAQSYAHALEGCTEAKLVAVCDVRAEAARALAETAGCPAFASHEEMATEAALDAAVVCTPPVTHPQICIALLERGLHVLCEKPLSIDVASAQKMIEAARAASLHLTMASKFRYVDDVVRAKAIVTSGILGEIVLFENVFTSRVDMSARWNSRPEVSGGGVLIDNGTHSVDLMRYFLGPLAEVQVVEGRRIQDLPVEETVRIFVRSASGVLGSIDLSWSINKELESYINIYGSHGSVFVGWGESRYRQSSGRDWVAFGRGYNKLQALSAQLVNFARSIRGEEKLLITADDALASVEAVEAAYAGLRRSQWVAVGRRDASAASPGPRAAS
jgi:predicted dehydrogenase